MKKHKKTIIVVLGILIILGIIQKNKKIEMPQQVIHPGLGVERVDIEAEAAKEVQQFDYDHYVEDWQNHIGERITVEGMVIQVLESTEKAEYLILLEDWENPDITQPKRIIVSESIELAAEGEEVLVGDIMKATGTFTGIDHRHNEDEEEEDIMTMEIDET